MFSSIGKEIDFFDGVRLWIAKNREVKLPLYSSGNKPKSTLFDSFTMPFPQWKQPTTIRIKLLIFNRKKYQFPYSQKYTMKLRLLVSISAFYLLIIMVPGELKAQKTR